MSKKKSTLEKEIYITPNIEIIDIEAEQNILAGGSGEGELPGMPASPW